jgi:hypothetical protein
VATRVPHATNTTSVWIHAPLLEEGKLVDMMFLNLLFAPVLAVTPTAARGRRTKCLKVQISLSFSFTVGFFLCCPLLL